MIKLAVGLSLFLCAVCSADPFEWDQEENSTPVVPLAVPKKTLFLLPWLIAAGAGLGQQSYYPPPPPPQQPPPWWQQSGSQTPTFNLTIIQPLAAE